MNKQQSLKGESASEMQKIKSEQEMEIVRALACKVCSNEPVKIGLMLIYSKAAGWKS